MPFTEEQFFAIFAQYNEAVWPLPVAAYVMGLIVLGLLFWESRASAILIPTFLAAFWVINGAGYHATYFVQINPTAPVFSVLFLFQALFLGVAPLVFGNMRFRLRRDIRTIAALALIVFAMLFYPLWGWFAGHVYPALPVFGLAPCPTTIFTIGVLFLADWTAARWLLIVPGIWAGIGGSAAILLGIPQDWGLVAALAAIALFAIGRWRECGYAMHGVGAARSTDSGADFPRGK